MGNRYEFELLAFIGANPGSRGAAEAYPSVRRLVGMPPQQDRGGREYRRGQSCCLCEAALVTFAWDNDDLETCHDGEPLLSPVAWGGHFCSGKMEKEREGGGVKEL